MRLNKHFVIIAFLAATAVLFVTLVLNSNSIVQAQVVMCTPVDQINTSSFNGCCGGNCGGCPTNQLCNIANGACVSKFSCNPNTGSASTNSKVTGQTLRSVFHEEGDFVNQLMSSLYKFGVTNPQGGVVYSDNTIDNFCISTKFTDIIRFTADSGNVFGGSENLFYGCATGTNRAIDGVLGLQYCCPSFGSQKGAILQDGASVRYCCPADSTGVSDVNGKKFCQTPSNTINPPEGIPVKSLKDPLGAVPINRNDVWYRDQVSNNCSSNFGPDLQGTTPTTPPGELTGGYKLIDSGISCVNSRGKCGPGYVNIQDAVDGGQIQTATNLTSSDFSDLVKDTYGSDNYPKLCIKDDIKYGITVYLANPTNVESASRPFYFGSPVNARFCPAGLVSSQGESKTFVGVTTVAGAWGCCRPGQRFAYTRNDAAAATTQQEGGCCDGSASHIEVDSANGVKRCINDANQIVGVVDNPAGFQGIPIGLASGNVDTTTKPSDPGYDSVSTLIKFGTDIVNKQICPTSTACAIVGGNTIVKASDLINTANLTCTKCFADGEIIAVNESTNSMKICNASAAAGTAPFTEEGRCNNSTTDTIACAVNGKYNKTNQDGTPSNYTLCCACRESGGVWTGIGCTDTTPLGLITGIIRIVFGVVGGIALLQLIIAGVMYQTGDEARIKSARDSIIKTLTGLAVLVFSILILRIIGINLLDVVPAGTI
ncbi:MAG: hypothetical protein ACMG57_01070 [Candidatus Dojkabacteria bacterium]